MIRRRSPSRSVLSVGVVVLGVVAAACGGSNQTSNNNTPVTTAAPTGTTAAGTATTAGGGASDKPLIIARGMDVNSLDPQRSYCDTCQIINTAVYETLLGLDQTDNKTLVPRLATKWEGNDDQTQFTFNLDPKAKFPDGTAVTSTDVKFSWLRLQALKGGGSYLAGTIKTIDDSDPAKVVVTLSQSNSAFLAQTNASYMGVVEKKLAEANGATLDPTTDKAEPWFLANSAGSGPFTLESYQSGSEVRLKRNDAYWGTKAKFPEVVIKETPQAVTQRQQLEAGAVDIAMQISTDVAKDMKSSDVTVTKVPSFNFVHLALSPGAKGAEKLTPDVRQAIKLALDYKGLLDVTVGGAGRSQPSPIPNGFAGTEGLPEPAQDLTQAKALMAKAGVTSLDLDATFPTLNVYGVDFSTAMQKVATDLKVIGINLKLNPVEISVWVDTMSKEPVPVSMLYFAPDHTDSSQYVQWFGLLPESQWTAWSKQPPNPDETTLLNKAFATKDATARAAVYKQLAEAMMADGVIIPLVNPDLYLASRSDIKGMHYSACCNLDLSKLSRG
jgi:peptide/nickel transport system substrate-binding protein